MQTETKVISVATRVHATIIRSQITLYMLSVEFVPPQSFDNGQGVFHCFL